ncbi:MAG: hypothetical protein LUP99_04545 [Methanomicrobiales archaeon]|nr:hypothetical protein [Methanomicrobiales archaeon]
MRIKKLFIGQMKYATTRVFIPLIQEIAGLYEKSGGYTAFLHTLVIVDAAGTWVYPFDEKESLEHLVVQVPELGTAINQAREFVAAQGS